MSKKKKKRKEERKKTERAITVRKIHQLCTEHENVPTTAGIAYFISVGCCPALSYTDRVGNWDKHYKNLQTWILVPAVLEECSLLMTQAEIRRLMMKCAFIECSNTTHAVPRQEDITKAENIYKAKTCCVSSVTFIGY